MAKNKKHIYNNFYTPEKWESVNVLNKAIMEDYLQELKQRQKKDTTIKQYRNDWRIVMIKIMELFGNKSILELSKKDWRRISLYFKESCEHSNARVNRLMSATRSMLTYCEDDDEDYGEYVINTASKVHGLAQEKVREIIFYTDDEIFNAYDVLIKDKKYQEATALMLAYDSGGRKNELLQVEKYSFINEEDSTNQVIGKRGKRFELVYFSKTKEASKLWLKQRGEDDLDGLFIQNIGGVKKEMTEDIIYRWFKSIAIIIGKNSGSVHSLRHSCAENMSQDVHSHYALIECGRPDGLALEEIQLHLNHSSSEVTASYLKDKKGQKKLTMFNLKPKDEEVVED